MNALAEQDQNFLDAVVHVADEFAAPNAADVDFNARFPRETIDALKEQGALSGFIPAEYGGEGVSLEAIAKACFELGRRCGASGMVFAMHQIQVACIVRHLDGEWFASYLREVASEQRLIASVTSEVGTGGDLGKSVAAITNGTSFEKQAPTVSYGNEADDLLTTVRRAEDAEPGDQVAVLTKSGQFELEQKGTWDVLGMRGTCSPGFVVRADFEPEQVISTPFPRVSAESMVPISHILWSHVWLGIATDAFDRSRAFVRESAKRSPGAPQPAAVRLSHLLSQLSLLRAEVHSGLRDFVEMDASPDRERLSTMAASLHFNNLKIAASEQAPRVCQGAMHVGGIVAFKNDSPFSVGRHLRDSMSGALMVANERIHQTNASLLLVAKEI